LPPVPIGWHEIIRLREKYNKPTRGKTSMRANLYLIFKLVINNISVISDQLSVINYSVVILNVLKIGENGVPECPN